MSKRYIFLFWLTSVLGSACSKDFLNNTPKGYQLASAAADYNNMLEESSLTNIADNTLGKGSFSPAAAPVILGDDITLLTPGWSLFASFYGGTLPTGNRLFAWSDSSWVGPDNSHELLGAYNRIYIANKIINEVLKSTGGTMQQKLQYHAEALASRAWDLFYLLNLFAKPYNAATASSDPGVPIDTVAYVLDSIFVRSSVQQVYDFIIDDMKAAIPDLPLIQTSSSRFTRAAGEALLGKIYLFMGDYNNAKAELAQAFADMPDHFSIAGTVHLIDYNTASENPYPIFQYVYTTADFEGRSYEQGAPYPETLLAKTMLSLNIGGNIFSGVMVTPETLSIFGSSDKRLDLFSSGWGIQDGYVGSIPYGLKRINAGNEGFSCGIQLPDMYLLSAEAKARTGDLAGATTDLVTLRKNRMPEVDAANVPAAKDDLIRFIIDERKREFCGFGMFRWQDMRRLSTDPLFAGQVYKHYMYDIDKGLVATYTLRPERLTLRLPEIVIRQNPGMQQNP